MVKTFWETIDGLIDLSGVPEAKRNGAEYEAARRSIHDDLPDITHVEVACHHEAAHWAEAVLAANQLGADFSRFTVIGPTIKYDALQYVPFDATCTGLRMGGMDNWRAQTSVDVEIMARIAVAGSESVHHFYGAKAKRGDANDMRRFTIFCKEVRTRLGGLIDPPHVYLQNAVRDVQADLRDDAFTTVVRRKAEAIKRECFGPVFDPHTTETQ